MSEAGNVEELMVKQGEMNMRLLINNAHRHLRFMDFRVGNYDDKREILDNLAAKRGLRKVFTLVEKQDTGSWRGAGLSREGVYPSFFRTADAYVMSRVYEDDGSPVGPSSPLPKTPIEQETVDNLGKRDRIRTKLSNNFMAIEDFMLGVNGHLRALPFGRTANPDVVLRAWLRNKEGWACAEIDESFGHAVIAFSPLPDSVPALRLAVTAAEQMQAELEPQGVNNMFGISSDQDTWSAQMFNALEYRVTGRLARHLTNDDGEAENALVWHKRLAIRK